MELYDIILNEENLNDLVMTNGGYWENDGIGHYDFQGKTGFDKGHNYFVYDGGFNFNFPVSLLDKEYQSLNDIKDNLKYCDAPNPTYEGCYNDKVVEHPQFAMHVTQIVNGMVYIYSTCITDDFTSVY